MASIPQVPGATTAAATTDAAATTHTNNIEAQVPNAEQKKEVNPGKEMEALALIAQIVTEEQSNKTTEKTIDERILAVYAEYSKYEIDLNKSIPFASNLTLIQLCELTHNIIAEIQLFSLGAHISEDTKISLETKFPILFKKLTTGIEERKRWAAEFGKEFTDAIQNETNGIKFKQQQEAEKAQQKFAAFQKECATLLLNTKKNSEKILTISKECSQDVSTFLLHGLKHNVNIRDNILSIAEDSVARTSAALTSLSSGLPDVYFRDHVFFYFSELHKISKSKTSLEEKIALLPEALKNKVQKIIDKDRKMISETLNGLYKIIRDSSQGFLQDYMKFIPKEMHGSISSERAGYRNPKLAEINNAYLTMIKEKIASDRKEFKTSFDPIVASFKNRDVIGKYIENHLKRFDAEMDDCFRIPAEHDPQLFQRFIANHAMYCRARNFIQKFTPIAHTFVRTISQSKYKSVDCEQIVNEMLSRGPKETTYVSHEEVQKQDRQRLKEIEQEKRMEAKEAELQRNKAILLLQKRQEEERKKQIEKDKAKTTLLEGMKKLSKEEHKLMEDILSGANLHREIEESLLEKLVTTLKLPVLRKTNNSAGGGIITIHHETISYHHWHGADRAGTLDGNCLKNLKGVFEKIGITMHDLPPPRPKKKKGHRK